MYLVIWHDGGVAEHSSAVGRDCAKKENTRRIKTVLIIRQKWRTSSSGILCNTRIIMLVVVVHFIRPEDSKKPHTAACVRYVKTVFGGEGQ